MPTDIAAIVLAAGASSRMGRPKQLLPLGGGTLLDAALAAVSGSDIDQVVLVLGAYEADIRARLWLDDCEVVSNPSWERGMMTSVQAGLRALGAGVAQTRGQPGDTVALPAWTVIMPCDYALTEQSTVIALLLRALREGGNVSLLRPAFFGRAGHPIVLGRELAALTLSANPDAGLDAVVREHREREVLVEVSDPAIHFDIDTPQDYETAQKAMQLRAESRDAYLKLLGR